MTEWNVNVVFRKEDTLTNISKEMQTWQFPQVVFWYIGCRGLRQFCVDFYRDNVINPFMKSRLDICFWLLDLTAWFAFLDFKGSITKSSSLCDLIEKCDEKRLRIIRSSELFTNMVELADEELIQKINDTLQKPFIKAAGEGYPLYGVQVKDVFPEGCSSMQAWYDSDTSKAYSAFQYFEGLLLVEKIIESLIGERMINEVNIAFLMPNDESRYYLDQEESFQKDLQLWLSKRIDIYSLDRCSLNVHFFPFQYGEQQHHRPYNHPSKVVDKKYISSEHVMGEVR